MGKDKALPNEKKMLTDKHRRNDGIRNSLVQNNISLMKMKVSQGTKYLHSLKVFPYKLLITNKRENGNFMVEKFGRHHLFQLLWLYNKLPLDLAPLNSHLLCSWTWRLGI